MNWGYLLTRAGIGALLWGFFTFGFDPLLRRGVIFTGETALGGRVEVARVESTFRSPTVTFSGLRIANREKPGTNLVEFDRLQMRFDGPQLLRKKYVVEEATLEGLRWDTPRDDSGVIEGWEPLSKRLDGDLIPQLDVDFDLHLQDSARALGREALDGLVKRARAAADPNQLESYRVAVELQTAWPLRFDDLKDRIERIDDRAKAIQKEAASAKGSTLEKVEVYARLLRDADRLLADVDRIRSELVAFPETARGDFGRMNSAKNRDLARLQQKIEMIPIDGDGLTDLLLGPTLKEQIRETMALVDRVRKAASNAPTDVEPMRLRGIDVAFPERSATPRYLLKSLRVSGETTLNGSPFGFEGTILDVTDDPVLHGKPVTVRLEGSGAIPMTLTATLDRTQERPRDEIELAWTNSTGSNQEFGNPDSLALRIAADRTECRTKLTLADGRLDGHVTWSQSPVKVTLHSTSDKSTAARPRAESLVRTASAEGHRPGLAARLDAVVDTAEASTPAFGADLMNDTLAHLLEKVERIDASLSFSRDADGAVSVSIDSELGPRLADGMKSGLMEALDARREQMHAKLDEELLKLSTDLRNMMGLRYKEVLASLDLREGEIKTLAGQLTGGKPIELQTLKPIKALRESKAAEDADKLLKGELPQNPKDIEHIRKDVRDLRNEIKTLRDARNLIRK